jgi:thioredoxin reductase (NADPH)
MEQMRAQAANVGAEMISDHIRELDLSQRPFRMVGDSGQVYLADTAVLATGAQAKWLGLDSETRLRGAGVSACATCDGFFYRGKTVAVVGGGNTAAEEALFLTNFAEEVILIHRRDELRADKLNQSRLFKNPKIRFVWNSEVQEVLGGGTPEGVVGVNVRNRQTGEVSTIDAEGLFIAIGHQPATELVKGQVAMKDGDYVITEPDSTVTSVPGFYAAGDVTDDIYRQAVTAAGMGCMAALEAERFLAAQGDEAEDMPQAAE